MNVDRFDLEQDIMNCWNVTTDIELLYENVLERSPEMTADEIANALLGLQALYEMKFDKMWRHFEQLVHEKKIV